MKVFNSLVPNQAPVDNITSGHGLNIRKLQASVLSVSELQSNPIYISARIRICSTRVNLNKQAVTKEFIEEIVVNKADYIGLPLYADTRRLLAKDYRRLGHLYDPSSGKFYTDQIGTFVDFEVAEDEFGTSLIGEVRISKRNDDICEAIVELFAAGNLKISFEVFYTDFVKENGVTIINKSERNRLISACVVSVPAYPEASALALVAEKDVTADVTKINFAEYTNSEVSIDTLVQWLYEYLYAMSVMDNAVIERIGPDFAILYQIGIGKTYKLDFAVMPSGLDILDLYEVEFVRKLETKGNDYMSNSEVKTDEVLVVVETTETVVAEEAKADVTETETVDVAVSEDAIEATADTDADNAEVSVESAEVVEVVAETVETVSLSDIMEVLKSLSARLDAIEAPAVEQVAVASEENVRVDAPDKGDQLEQNLAALEAAQKENRDTMTQLAEARGFDVTNDAVAAAIEALDYKKLLECENSVVSAAATINGVADDINVGGNIHPSLEKA